MNDKNNKSIPVVFAYYEPYEHFPNTVYLTHATLPQARKLMNAIERRGSNSDSCFKTLHATMTRATRCGRMVGPHSNWTTVSLDGMFYFYDVTTPSECHAPCMAGARRMPQTEYNMICACAYRLRTGKCCDPFIRRTLGRLLFPHHYVKQKTK